MSLKLYIPRDAAAKALSGPVRISSAISAMRDFACSRASGSTPATGCSTTSASPLIVST